MAKGFCDLTTVSNLNTRDIIASQTAGVQKILDYMCAEEKERLRDRIGTLELSAALQAQGSNIISQLQPVAKPAYIVSSPYASAVPGYGLGWGLGYGLGYGY